MSADEASHWDMLHDGWMVDRVNHSEICRDHGKHTTWLKAISRDFSVFLQRFRRHQKAGRKNISFLLCLRPIYMWVTARHRSILGRCHAV